MCLKTMSAVRGVAMSDAEPGKLVQTSSTDRLIGRWSILEESNTREFVGGIMIFIVYDNVVHDCNAMVTVGCPRVACRLGYCRKLRLR
ncbi:hypothetical protein ACI65C_004101 [Semiaphis heraclei]